MTIKLMPANSSIGKLIKDIENILKDKSLIDTRNAITTILVDLTADACIEQNRTASEFVDSLTDELKEAVKHRINSLAKS